MHFMQKLQDCLLSSRE